MHGKSKDELRSRLQTMSGKLMYLGIPYLSYRAMADCSLWMSCRDSQVHLLEVGKARTATSKLPNTRHQTLFFQGNALMNISIQAKTDLPAVHPGSVRS